MGVRTSGQIPATGTVYSGSVRVASIFVQETGSSTAQITVYDNTAASGTKICTIKLASGERADVDLHGVMCTNGIHLVENTK